ncbi:hypothetical protein BC941DRAFT_468651 [Chlamydoabsidia padenii]|nr:hypothetical protein BC941DRAFT_468651 [Chlamydoabsidia padenii]
MVSDISTFSNPAIFDKSLRAKSLRVHSKSRAKPFFSLSCFLFAHNSSKCAGKKIRWTVAEKCSKPTNGDTWNWNIRTWKLQERLYLKKKKTRRSSRNIEKSSPKKQKMSKDFMTIAGLNGTLGANLIRLGELEMKTKKQRYFGLLSKNALLNNGDHTRLFLEKHFSYDQGSFGINELDLSGYEQMMKKILPTRLQLLYADRQLC